MRTIYLRYSLKTLINWVVAWSVRSRRTARKAAWHGGHCPTPGAQLGWHVDQTERDRVSPIVTFSLGASCVFWIELGPEGEAVRYRHTLRSGDAVVMAGPARLARHQVTNVHADEPDLFSQVYNPIAKSAPGVRLSFSVRRTGW